MNGAFRFLSRVWRAVLEHAEVYDGNWNASVADEAASNPAAKALRRKVHQTIRKVGDDIDKFAFNTAVAALMEMVNEMQSFSNTCKGKASACMSEAVEMLVLLLAPMTPHIADELWEELGKTGFTIDETWPSYDSEVAKADEVEIVIQINGKIREKLVIPADSDEEAMKLIVMENAKIKSEISGKTIRKMIIVKGKLVNIVVG